MVQLQHMPRLSPDTFSLSHFKIISNFWSYLPFSRKTSLIHSTPSMLIPRNTSMFPFSCLLLSENFVPRQQGTNRNKEQEQPGRAAGHWGCHLFAGCSKRQLAKKCAEHRSGPFGFFAGLSDPCILNSLTN